MTEQKHLSKSDVLERLRKHCKFANSRINRAPVRSTQRANQTGICIGLSDAIALVEQLPDDDAREREVAELRKFAQLIMQAWQDGGIDGGDLQDIAIGCGLLKPTEMTEPCGEVCICAEVDDFPATCYRATTLLTGAQQQEPEQ